MVAAFRPLYPGKMASDVARSIKVGGSGVCPVVPDMARLSVGVSLQSPNLGQARTRVGTKMQAARQALIKRGVSQSDLTTTRLNIQSFRNNTGPSQYQVSTMVNAVIRQLDGLDTLVNQVLDAVEDGAELHGVTFDRADRSEAIRAAREAAFSDAHEKASHLAQLAGVSLGEVLNISEEEHNYGRAPRMAQMKVMAEGSIAAMPIDGGELVEQANVSVTWSLLTS